MDILIRGIEMGLFKRPNYKPAKFDGTFSFSDFSYGLYNLDTPRTIGEQLASLGLTGGRNVWTEKGALVNQYGYNSNGIFDAEDIPRLVSSDNSLANNIFIICENNKIYNYTTLEGLKKYKTEVELANPIIAHKGDILYIYDNNKVYQFGGVYNEPGQATPVPIISDREAKIRETFFDINITEDELDYFWLDKQIVFTADAGSTYIVATVSSITPIDDDEIEYNYTIRFFTDCDINNDINITIAEKTIIELAYSTSEASPEFCWINEPDAITPQIADSKIVPKLMAVALNRLWIVDENNVIFYSAVGNLASFEQANGAGFFYGFYDDTSEVLSLEEFYSGVLVTKQTGMYHIRLTTNQYSFGNGTTVAKSTDDNYINIEKLNNITQKYPGDHVIIGGEVIAFDSSSGNLVQAVYVNYLGNLQEGTILLHGSELDSQGLGLQAAVNRVLAYSFQDEVLLLYYDKMLDKALVITRGLSIFPRETDRFFLAVEMFSQGFINITVPETEGKVSEVLEDFKRGTIIPNIKPSIEFEPVALRSNLMLCGTIIEITELDGIEYDITTNNAGFATQHVVPPISQITADIAYPNFVYSDKNLNLINSNDDGYSKWAYKKSQVTRIAAPLSGRDGLSIGIEFEPNQAFCIPNINLPDLSQGE